jgi:hypothetical protein
MVLGIIPVFIVAPPETQTQFASTAQLQSLAQSRMTRHRWSEACQEG